MQSRGGREDDEDGEEDVDSLLQRCLDRLAAGYQSAKNDLITVAYARLTQRAHQLLGGFPVVKQSYDTGDIVNEACLRLMKTLKDVQPDDARSFLGLAGWHIRNELIDLYRRCRGPNSYEANQATNAFRGSDGELHFYVNQAAACGEEPRDSRWEQIHAAAERLDGMGKEIFHMRWFLGMTHDQIAVQLGCSEKTVKREWARIKDFLRREGGDAAGA